MALDGTRTLSTSFSTNRNLIWIILIRSKNHLFRSFLICGVVRWHLHIVYTVTTCVIVISIWGTVSWYRSCIAGSQSEWICYSACFWSSYGRARIKKAHLWSRAGVIQEEEELREHFIWGCAVLESSLKQHKISVNLFGSLKGTLK